MIRGTNCGPELQRIRYKKGQMLASRDFQDDLAIANTLRWMHTRALHKAYGIRKGLSVIPLGSDGKPSSSGHPFIAVEVQEGIAYDCYGRELIQQKARRVSLPSAPSKKREAMILIIRHRKTLEFLKHNEIHGTCFNEFQLPLIEQPEIFWKTEAFVELIDGVPLGKLSYNLDGSPSFSGEESRAPFSRPFARPRIASGTTIPGNTQWEEWVENNGNNSHIIGYQTTIDTSAASFTTTPCYFARLEGLPWNGQCQQFLLQPFFVNIHAEKPTEFTFRYFLIPPYAYAPEENHQLFVSWIGIEHTTAAQEDKAVEPIHS